MQIYSVIMTIVTLSDSLHLVLFVVIATESRYGFGKRLFAKYLSKNHPPLVEDKWLEPIIIEASESDEDLPHDLNCEKPNDVQCMDLISF